MFIHDLNLENRASSKKVSLWDSNLSLTNVLKNAELGYVKSSIMQVSISSITIPPPRTPGDLHQKFAPTWGFCILAFAGGGRDLLG